MKLSELSQKSLQRSLGSNGISCVMGSFVVHVKNSTPGFAATMQLLYGDMQIQLDPLARFNDFVVHLTRPRNTRYFWHPQVVFKTERSNPFAPFPLSHGFPHFEWGLNWLIALEAHQYLMLHAAVLERNGRAIILPAEPGSGKSTLGAALMLRGWRLLSDEFGLYRPETGMLEPLPRPIPLKNESIEVIRQFSGDAVLGPVYDKTRKGDVAHLRPSDDSMARSLEPAKPAWVVFPKFISGAKELLHPFARGRAFLKLTGNAFNYRLQGARGFNGVVDLIDACDTWYLEFGDLERAVALLDQLAAGKDL